MKRLVFTPIFLLIFFLHSAYGQQRVGGTYERFIDRLYAGGAFGLAFGSITQIDIVPLAGIWVIPQWTVGVGGRYSYYNHKGLFMGGTGQSFRSMDSTNKCNFLRA